MAEPEKYSENELGLMYRVRHLNFMSISSHDLKFHFIMPYLSHSGLSKRIGSSDRPGPAPLASSDPQIRRDCQEHCFPSVARAAAAAAAAATAAAVVDPGSVLVKHRPACLHCRPLVLYLYLMGDKSQKEREMYQSLQSPGCMDYGTGHSPVNTTAIKNSVKDKDYDGGERKI